VNSLANIVQSVAARKVAPKTFEYLERIQRMLAPDVLDRATGMHYGEQVKRVSVRISAKKFKRIELLHITDVQFGHVECRYHRVAEYRDWVLAEPNRFMFWGGDMIDAYAAWSPGTAWDNLFDPQSQVYRFVECWAPARHRILGFVGGNHERRAIPGFGDLGVLLATLLKVPYSNGQQLVDIHYGAWKPHKTHLWHGRGAARTDGGKMQMMMTFVKDHPGSHLYLVGHLHTAMMRTLHSAERREDKLDVRMVKGFAAMSSSFLSTWGTYSEVSGLSPHDCMMACLVLEPDGGSEMTWR